MGVVADHARLRELRARVFRDELGVQDAEYRDVFSDAYSKNVLLLKDAEVIGAVRLAFGREQQEFYISYLFILPEHRKAALLRLLFGAVITLMTINGIEYVRADSADENLQMYLSLGCSIVGKQFTKYGFRCSWTPLVYRLGTKPDAERIVMNRVLHFFHDLESLRWSFSAAILTCKTVTDFDEVLSRLVALDRIPGSIPHLGDELPVLDAPWIQPVQHTQAHEIGGMCGQPHMGAAARTEWDPLAQPGAHTARTGVVLVRRDSPAVSLAACYSLLTARRLSIFNSWDDVAARPLDCASVLYCADPSDRSDPAFCSLLGRVRGPISGIVGGVDAASLSAHLLRSYFSFLGPLQLEQRLARIALIPVSTGTETDLWCDRRVCEALERGATHCVLIPEGTSREAISLFQSLLSSGESIGAAVRLVALAFSTVPNHCPVVIGDPSLRVAPPRPHTGAESSTSIPPRTAAAQDQFFFLRTHSSLANAESAAECNRAAAE
jgi:hypothetical protein